MSEINHQPYLDNLSTLQEGRFNLAVHTSERELRNAILGRDRIIDPGVDITNIKNDGFEHYCPMLDASNLLSLEAIGLESSTVIKTAEAAEYGTSALELTTVRDGAEQLSVFAADKALKIRFDIDGIESWHNNSNSPTNVTELVQARFAKSPAHQAMHKAGQSLRESETTPEQAATEEFDPKVDPLGTLAFLDDIGLLSTHYLIKKQPGQSVDHILSTALSEVPEYKATISETDLATTYTWNNHQGVVRTLSVAKDSGFYTYNVRQDPAHNYLEKANQSPDRAVPFIETACAAELCKALDSAGLMFHPSLQAEMMNPSEADRYGSIYTELSRTVAKWVNDPARLKLSDLFVPLDDKFYGAEMAKRMTRYSGQVQYEYSNTDFNSDGDNTTAAREELTRTRWASANKTVQSESAQVLLDMISDSLARDQATPINSDLPVTNSDIQIRNGACFDVTSYYVGAATMTRAEQRLKKISVNGVNLLEKTMGSHTFLSTEPLVFNGVRLPKGALFSKGDDDKWAFLRLTAFAFDNPNDQTAAAGSELAKTYANEQQSLKELGGVTLAHLVKKSLV